MILTTNRASHQAALMSRIFDGFSGEAATFLTSSSGLMRLMQRASQDDCAIEEAVGLANAEPLVAAKMVAIANSAAYGRSGRVVTNVGDAVNLLGLSMLKAVASAVAVGQMADRAAKANETIVSTLWIHSVEVAALAAVIAKRFTDVPGDTALFAGILHEIAGFYALSKAVEAVDLTDGDVVSALKGDVVDQDDKAKSILAMGTARMLSFLEVPDEVADAIVGQWRGYVVVPPETLTDTLLIANMLATTRSPFDLVRSSDATGLDLDEVLSRSEVAEAVKGAYDQVRSVQQAFARRSA